MAQQSLVSISEACRILGVSEPALRQWTDEGKIKAFITPGGHRRYSPEELRRFRDSPHKVLGVKDLASRLEDTLPRHRELDRAFLQSTSGQGRLSKESQERLASLGRNLLELIIKSITQPSKQDETLTAVREVGTRFGETLARLGMPLTDSVHAFIQHREPIVSVTTELMKKREGFNRRIVESLPLVDQAMDEALVSLVIAHQQYQKSSQSPKLGDPE